MNIKPKILIGVSGGIAAYKALEVISLLQMENFDVFVAMTPSSQEFIKPLTFEALTNNPVQTKIFPEKNNGIKNDLFPHLFPSSLSNYFAVIPATANLIAKLAYGIADDIVSASALALPLHAKRFFCPAMNINMWSNVTVQKNIKKLISSGWIMIGPKEGRQACGDYGFGKLEEPKLIAQTILNTSKVEQIFKGEKILILSGPTKEYIDPVRFISNASSGKMGKALAIKAADLGAKVKFISGNVAEENLPKNPAIEIINTISGNDMLKAALKEFKTCDIAIFAAAVSDFTPVKYSNEKIKNKTSNYNLILKQTKDIAATLCKNKNKKQICIGFALETSKKEKDNGILKLKTKNLNAIVLNNPSSLSSDKAKFKFISKVKDSYHIEEWGLISKELCAEKIFTYISKLLIKTEK